MWIVDAAHCQLICVRLFGNRGRRNATDRKTNKPIEEQFLHSAKCGMSLFGHFCSFASTTKGACIATRKGARTAQRRRGGGRMQLTVVGSLLVRSFDDPMPDISLSLSRSLSLSLSIPFLPSSLSERLIRRTILRSQKCPILHWTYFLAFRGIPIIPLRRSPPQCSVILGQFSSCPLRSPSCMQLSSTMHTQNES